MFEPFLKLYQTDAPTLLHMNGDLLELIKSILRMFSYQGMFQPYQNWSVQEKDLVEVKFCC